VLFRFLDGENVQKMKTQPIAPAVKYGLWDTRDKCWIGREDGPLSYTEHLHASAAATIATEQCGRRIRPVPLPAGDEWVLKDTEEVRFTGAEAIARIEGRAK
jgi:hypothetical protein